MLHERHINGFADDGYTAQVFGDPYNFVGIGKSCAYILAGDLNGGIIEGVEDGLIIIKGLDSDAAVLVEDKAIASVHMKGFAHSVEWLLNTSILHSVDSYE